jgi:choline kinase
VKKLDQLVEAGNRREWAPRAFAAFAAEQPLYAVGTRGYPWTEIDFPEDYERAVRQILPQIDASAGSPTARDAAPRLRAVAGAGGR